MGALGSATDTNAPDAPTTIRETPAWQKALTQAGFRYIVEQQADGTWQLNLNKQNITDLTILRGASISGLWLEDTPVSDLGPLHGMPLTYLEIGRTRVTDLSPLAGMDLQNLQMSRTAVTDLLPLRGMPLRDLSLMGCTNLTEIGPLEGMTTLERVILPRTAKHFEFLRNNTNLERVSFRYRQGDGPAQTAAEFWAAQDQSAPAKP